MSNSQLKKITISDIVREEEEDEIITAPLKVTAVNHGSNYFRRKEGKSNMTEEEMGFKVDEVIALLEVAAEEDALLNIQEKPCIHKLRNLPLLLQVLSKKQLQKVLISHGIFTVVKNWLEPLPDGNLPNVHIREAILYALTNQFRIDLKQFSVREELKKSGLGKAILFLSKLNEETSLNRKLAKDLVLEWRFGIMSSYNKRFGDFDEVLDDQSIPSKRRNLMMTSSNKLDDDVLRPEKSSLNFVIRPKSKRDPVAMKAHKLKVKQDERCSMIVKKLKKVYQGRVVKRLLI